MPVRRRTPPPCILALHTRWADTFSTRRGPLLRPCMRHLWLDCCWKCDKSRMIKPSLRSRISAYLPAWHILSRQVWPCSVYTGTHNAVCCQTQSPSWPGEQAGKPPTPRQAPPPSPQGVPAAAVHLHLDSPEPPSKDGASQPPHGMSRIHGPMHVRRAGMT